VAGWRPAVPAGPPPIISAVYALVGNAAKVTCGSYPYAYASDLFDVTSGANGTCTRAARDKYLCTARNGYDAPSGLGIPGRLPRLLALKRRPLGTGVPRACREEN
jgi:hypothetical protein